MKIEICLESVQSVINAEKGGADRVELCSDLFEGGLTPSIGTYRIARAKTNIPISVMIRPRGGDFCYSDLEFETMCEDVKQFVKEGAESLVFGILTKDGEVDVKRTKKLIDLAQGRDVTFHRAFDMTKDMDKALETLIDLKVTRVLTSGGEASVLEGFQNLARLVTKAGDRIVIMPGCGITQRNFDFINEHVKAKEYHVFLPKSYSSKMEFRPDHIFMGGVLKQPEFDIYHTDKNAVGDITGR